ncbi:tRNA (adenine22-N1)-methyltransferase [Enterococcus sp. PF1-24]|uniref:tRNA (adenine(22)-N(1))-methyltransferase n=1 Tax=unclassified Enterococcus TaxID=2608891 RepID=UPI002474B915|nr:MULTISPECIES: tRNA (adenine(22)-N(1))-methyltransferase TrmK [unclassified Enterococcus]MDH6365221.1 tRNA (adenine22-N1)-methyltransferase [Enterococcus sp. PFB1-1]MDH6402322.1 tRNA (adenine22-N1)-methyltransferase [Enterococcus sp. PF1-24]
MNHQELSKRLEMVGRFVPENSRLADIGSDHAYLPVFLALKQQISYGIAGEVVLGPFQSAEKQVAKNGLQGMIDVRLADGLAAISPADKIDVITICGMGGSLIRSILEAGKNNQQLTLQERLILQANIGEALLREWLQANQYQIIAEEILEENHKIYEIIVAELSETAVSYTKEELYFGPYLLKTKNAAFIKKWQRELHQRQQVLAQLKVAKTPQTEKITEIQAEISMIEIVLN